MNAVVAPTLKRRGLMLVLSSPSGAGKTTISRILLEREEELTLSISATTRQMRPGEIHGKDYFFVSAEEFDAMVENNEMLEHATVFDNKYGTPSEPVEQGLSSGKDVLFDIDWQGTQQVAAKAPNDIVRVFILPPSLQELERRLYARAQDSEEVVKGRMAKAADEMSHWAEYDYIIVNTDIEKSVADVQAILRSERLKRDRRPDLDAFVRGLRQA
ncbi:guanylate kinase [Kiloniella spongiae]|uniref:Guanylate kinase n=1 Tax=Kiloniella spongiae TaxID=1489064 RepID=A0A0H2MCC3_9PROT|nr:guanylate kinase [Kiloniella spongiae]KLN60209.1 guanylate kinase [Kiloniella spongiae]